MVEKKEVIFHGPLRVSAINPRYFTDDSGRAIYLTGSHTWANLVDIRNPGDPVFDYEEYLDFMAAHHHNYMRMWAWHHGPRGVGWSNLPVEIDPVPYLRSGSDLAADQQPRFDLTRFNPAYFERLRKRIVAAGERGIYVSVMLFEGSTLTHPSVAAPGSYWTNHPYNAANNVNGFNGDPNGDGRTDVFTLEFTEAQDYLKAYVRQVIDAVNDLDNVFYEVANELDFGGGGLAWQYHMAEYIREYERSKPKLHPIGITSDGSGRPCNQELFDSPADWIAPYCVMTDGSDEPYHKALFGTRGDWITPWWGSQDDYRSNPPPADGSKVILNDTDHLWGHGGNYRWVWKSFLRGLNPVFMDPWVPSVGCPPDMVFNTRNYPEWGLLRTNMGYTRLFTERLDMNVCLPHGELASSGYCLAEIGKAYLIYLPDDARVVVDTSAVKGRLAVEWFNPRSGVRITAAAVQGEGRSQWFTSPIGIDVVLYLYTRA